MGGGVEGEVETGWRGGERNPRCAWGGGEGDKLSVRLI